MKFDSLNDLLVIVLLESWKIMKKNNVKALLVIQFLFLFYLIINLTIYILSKKGGTEGVSLMIFGGSDDGRFYWSQVKAFLDGRGIIGTSIYPYIISYIVKITKINDVIVIRMFNYLGFALLIFVSIYLCKIILRYNNTAIKKDYRLIISIFFMCYLSMLMNVNLSIYRDVWIYLFYLITLTISIKLILQKKYILLLPLFFSLLILGGFRDYALLSFFTTIIVYFFLRGKKNILMVLFYSIILFGVFYTFFIDLKLPVVEMSLKDALSYRTLGMEDLAGSSQMNIELDQSNFIYFVISFCYSFLSNFFGPFPWQISGISTLIVFLFETIPMIFIIAYIWRNRNRMNAAQIYCFLHALMWTVLISVINDNIGTATRLRALCWCIVIVVFTTLYCSESDIQKNKNQ